MYRPILVALALAAGCKSAPAEDPSNRVERAVTSPDGDLGAVVDGHNALTWELYGEVAAGESGNVFFSPFSLTAALGMVLAGAEGVSEDELSDLLRVDVDEASWHHELGALLRDLNGDFGRGYTLHVANRLFGQDGYPWEPDFLAVCDTDYDAPLDSWPFDTDPEGGRALVNGWVADQTASRIPELLPAGSVSENTRLVLANAIYFLADWAEAFDEEDTRDRPFRRSDGSTVDVPIMYRTDDLRVRTSWNHADGPTLVRLPYQDDELSMILVIPDTHDGLPALEAGLDAATFDGWVQEMSRMEVAVGLPRLHIEWELELSDVVRALGAPSLFDSTTADLTGLASTDDSLFVSGLYHKAFVKVDEAGTEAAAATGAVISLDSGPVPAIADRPFLFVIRDDLTGTLLFVGRVTDPSAP